MKSASVPLAFSGRGWADPAGQGLLGCPVPDQPWDHQLSSLWFAPPLHHRAQNWTRYSRLPYRCWIEGKNHFPQPGAFIRPNSQLSNITVQLCVTPPSGNMLVILVKLSWERGRDKRRQDGLPCRTWYWSILGKISRLPFRSLHEIMRCWLQKSSSSLA